MIHKLNKVGLQLVYQNEMCVIANKNGIKHDENGITNGKK